MVVPVVFCELVARPVQLKAGISYTVPVPPHDGPEKTTPSAGVGREGIKAQDNVCIVPFTVGDHQGNKPLPVVGENGLCAFGIGKHIKGGPFSIDSVFKIRMPDSGKRGICSHPSCLFLHVTPGAIPAVQAYEHH